MMKTKNLLLLFIAALLINSCSEPQVTNNNIHAIAIEEGYDDFNQAMLAAKGIVQEVLIAAYNNPDLSDFGNDVVVNRNDCPNETDLNPDAFPKTLRYNYGDETCQSEGQSEMIGIVEVIVSDKLGTPGMTITVNPMDNFAKDGHSAALTDDENSIFMARFKSDTDLNDAYDLFISGLEVTDEQGNVATIKNLEGASIGFDDINENNENTNVGTARYLDDLAIVHFERMELINHLGENLNVTMKSDVKFDFLCECPLGGLVEIEDQDKNTQYINYSSNEECSGRILVDAEEIGC